MRPYHGEIILNIPQYNGLVICELSPNGGLLGSGLTALVLIGEVYNANPDLIGVSVSRLPSGFLDVSTLIASEVFQKMEQYGPRLAIQGEIAAKVAASKSLNDFVYETNRRGHHLLVPGRAALLARVGG